MVQVLDLNVRSHHFTPDWLIVCANMTTEKKGFESTQRKQKPLQTQVLYKRRLDILW